MRPSGAMCLPHTNNMDNKLQGAGPGGGASLRSRGGGVPLEPFIHQVSRHVCENQYDTYIFYFWLGHFHSVDQADRDVLMIVV